MHKLTTIVRNQKVHTPTTLDTFTSLAVPVVVATVIMLNLFKSQFCLIDLVRHDPGRVLAVVPG